MTAFSDKMTACRLEAKALVDEAQRLMPAHRAGLLQLFRISGVSYDTLRLMRKGEARRPSADTLQKLRDTVAKLREGAAE